MDIAIEYRLTKKDLLFFGLSQALGSWKMAIVIDVVCTYLVVKFLEDTSGWNPGWSVTAAVIYFVCMLFLLFSVLFLKTLYIQFILNRKILDQMLSTQKFVATNELAYFQLGRSESKIQWSNFLRISLNKRFLLLWLNSTAVKVIPWRFFSNEERTVLSEFIKSQKLKS